MPALPPTPEGFHHNGRIIYALEYVLERGGWVIVWIDDDGQSTDLWNRPAPPREKMVHVRPGDCILHKGEPLKVKAVRVWRELAESRGIGG